MSADYNKDLSLDKCSSSGDFMPSLSINAVSDIQYCDLSKTSGDGRSQSASPKSHVMNSGDFGLATDLACNVDEWKNDFTVHLHSDSSEPRASNKPTSNLNLRYRNMLNFPKFLRRKGLTFEKKLKRYGITTDPVYALKLLTNLIQPFINREIDAIIKRYSKEFLCLAIENIRYNLGEGAVSENELQHLQYNIMKEAAAQYRVPGSDSPFATSNAVPANVGVQDFASPSPASSITSAAAIAPGVGAPAAPPADLRRSVLLRSSRHPRHQGGRTGASLRNASPLSDTQHHSGASALPPPLLLLNHHHLDGGSGRSTPAKRRRRGYGSSDGTKGRISAFLQSGGAGSNSGHTPLNGASPMTDCEHSAVDTFGPLELGTPGNGSPGHPSSIASDAVSTVTAQSFHHPPGQSTLHLHPQDNFTLGSCANVWLGMGAARGRVYSKYPWIFRYPCDRVDKTWLSRAGHLPNCGAKAFLLLVRQIHQVAALEQGENETLAAPVKHPQPLKQFNLPPWLFQKVLDSATSRGLTVSRQPTTNNRNTATTNHLHNSTASAVDTTTQMQQSSDTAFMDHFEFTVDDEEAIAEMECPPAGYFIDELKESAVPWANGEKTNTLPPIRNGRGNNTQSDTAYKTGRPNEASLKIGHT